MLFEKGRYALKFKSQEMTKENSNCIKIVLNTQPDINRT